MDLTSGDLSKMTPGELKSEKIERQGDQKWPKGIKSEPRESQRGAKGRPKCSAKAIFGQGREKGEKRDARRMSGYAILGTISHDKSIQSQCGNSCRT